MARRDPTDPAPPEGTRARPMWRFLRTIARSVFIVAFGGRVHGRRHLPASGAALLVSNHQSYFDPVLVALPMQRECCFLARDSLFRNRYFGPFITWLNAHPIKRGSADVGAVRTSMRLLKDGRILVVFPEATRTTDGGIRAMQPGAILLARRVRVPIVPALVAGAFRAFPRSARFPRPARITVAYGAPIRPEQLDGLSDADAIARVRGRILALAARHAPGCGECRDAAGHGSPQNPA